MRIAIGSDHARVPLKETMIAELQLLGHQGVDRGAHATSERDDYAEAVGRVVLDCNAESAVLIRGSVVIASVAANKLPGIRAAVCHDTYSAHQVVEHNNVKPDFWVRGSSGQNWRWTWCASSLGPSSQERRAPFGGWRRLTRSNARICED